jgi:CMP-N,N'-diacetyllegionaminic acid synthase
VADPAHGVLAVVPARRGSKGLPLKNLRPLAGVPLLVHSIRAALAASLVNAVVVSTEDDEIAAVAAAHGATVVKRPAELATDTAQNNGVLRHVLESFPGQYRHVVLLQPTSPLRSAAHIDACLDPLIRGAARSAMTITPVEHHPGKAVHLNGDLVEPFTNEADMEARRQTMREVYRQNGAVYAVGVEDFLTHDRLYLRPCHGVVVPAEDSVDIDSELDLMLAELVLRKRQA